MFQSQSLNQSARQLVNNIYNNFNTHPNFIDYHCSFSEELNCSVINITKGGRNVNMYRFYPDHTGNLGSIAIYGIALDGHFKTINGTKKIFGLDITDIEFVKNNTVESFVDVTLL